MKATREMVVTLNPYSNFPTTMCHAMMKAIIERWLRLCNHGMMEATRKGIVIELGALKEDGYDFKPHTLFQPQCAMSQ